jgi:zinc transporter
VGGTPGLIWAFDLGPGRARPTDRCDSDGEGFRWLHLSLAHRRTQSWIEGHEDLPDDVKDMMLAQDSHQRAMVDEGVIACVLHDFERDFEQSEDPPIGALRFALTPKMMITARLHPIRSADVIRNKLARTSGMEDPAEALELLIGTITEGISARVREQSISIQNAEDAFLDGRDAPTSRGMIEIRRRHSRVHRMLDGLRAVFRRLEGDDDVPENMVATIEGLSQRVQALGADSLATHRQIRQLREEIDHQNDQRTNQNLYFLSIMTGLMLPATFVTGLFGMNTGGFPWHDSSHGTLWATILAFGAAAVTYLLLRRIGLMRK